MEKVGLTPTKKPREMISIHLSRSIFYVERESRLENARVTRSRNDKKNFIQLNRK